MASVCGALNTYLHGEGEGVREEVATGGRAAEESKRSGWVKPRGTVLHRTAGSSGAR